MGEPKEKRGHRDLNKVILAGRLVAEPIFRLTKDGKVVASYRIASGRGDVNDTTDFFNISAFGRSAVWVKKVWEGGHLVVGQRLTICGHAITGNYEREVDGVKVKVPTFEIVAEDQEFSGPKPKGSDSLKETEISTEVKKEDKKETEKETSIAALAEEDDEDFPYLDYS